MIRDWLRRRGQSSILPPTLAPLSPGQYVSYYGERSDGNWMAFLICVIAQRSDGMWGYEVRGKEASHETLLLLLHAPGKPLSEYGWPMPAAQGGAEVRRGTVSDQQGSPLAHAVRIGNLFGGATPPEGPKALARPPVAARLPCGITEVYPARFAIPFSPDRYVELNRSIPITGVARDTFAGEEERGLVLTSFGSSKEPIPDSWDYLDLDHVQRCDYDGFSVAYPATWFLDPSPVSTERDRIYGSVLGGCSCAIGFMVQVERQAIRAETEARHRELLAESAARPRAADLRGVQHTTKPMAGGGQFFLAEGETRRTREMDVAVVLQSPETNETALIGLHLSASKGHPDLARMLAEIPALGERIGSSFQFRSTV